MKNVVIISEAALVYGNSAAVARMNNYAKALAQESETCVYLFSQKYFTPEANIVEISRNIYTTERPDKENKRTWREALKFAKQVKSFCANLKGDTIYLLYPSSNPIVEVAFLFIHKIIGKSKVFCEINEVRKYAVYLHQVSFPRRFLIQVSNYIMGNLIVLYDGIICISSHIENYFQRKNGNRIVVPILSDIPRTMQLNQNDSETLRFVFTGTVNIEKENLQELLKGFALFDRQRDSGWELLLYGNCDKTNREGILRITSELGIGDKIRLMGEVPHSDIPRILSMADCLLLPRKNNKQNYYGFSTKLSEYAVSGKPVLLTDTSVVADYFEDGKNCLMTRGFNAEDFYEKLLEFASMSVDQKENMGKEAFRTAAAYFDWKNYTRQLDDFLK